MTCLEYCQKHGIWIDKHTYRAARWLERHGYVFLVDFGYTNAIDRMAWAKAGWLR